MHPRGWAARGPIRVSYVPHPSDAAGSRGGLGSTHSGSPGSAQMGSVQVGYAIGRKTASAVGRNRLRRRCRAAVQQVAAELPPGRYLIRPAGSAATLAFPALVDLVGSAMRDAAGTEGGLDDGRAERSSWKAEAHEPS